MFSPMSKRGIGSFNRKIRRLRQRGHNAKAKHLLSVRREVVVGKTCWGLLP
jgi:hypothetical protein